MLGRLGDEHAQLGLRVHVVVRARRLQPEPAQDDLGRALQEPDQRPHDDEEDANGRDDEQSRPLGVAERDSLRDELADDDVQEGQQEIREHDREHGGEEFVEQVRQRLLADRADGQ